MLDTLNRSIARHMNPIEQRTRVRPAVLAGELIEYLQASLSRPYVQINDLGPALSPLSLYEQLTDPGLSLDPMSRSLIWDQP